MALIWFDGFETYGTGIVTDRFAGLYIISGNTASVNNMPELGGRGFRQTNNPGPRFEIPNGPVTSGTYGVGFHLYLETSSRKELSAFTDPSAGRVYSIQTQDSRISIRTPDGIVQGESLISTNILYHVEMKLIQHPTEGSIELRVDGRTEILLDNLNTAVELASVRIGTSGVGTGVAWIDNWYIWDGTGDDNNDWMGERNVYVLWPDEDVPPQDWIPSSGSDAYAMINNVSEASYLEAQNVGDTSAFNFSELPSNDIIINGVIVTTRAQKTGTADTEMSFGVGNDRSGNQVLTQDQFLGAATVYEKNPDTGNDWEASEVNLIEVQIERDL